MIELQKCVLSDLGILNFHRSTLFPQNDGSGVFKTLFTTICGSDLRIFEHGDSRISEPRALGHEIVAVVVSPGLREDLNPGDFVAIGADIPCKSCFYCAKGFETNCEEHIAVGYQFDGGFSNHIVIPCNFLLNAPIVKLAPSDLIEAYCLAEPAACVIHGLEYSNVRQDQRILVVGAGPVGLMIGKLAIDLFQVNKDDITFIERSDMRKRFAESLGLQTLSEMPKAGNSFDRIFTANSDPSSIKGILGYLDKGGMVNFFGGLPKGAGFIEIDVNTLHYREMTLGGSHGSTPMHHMRAVNEISKNEKFWSSIITKKMSFRQIPEALGILRSGTEMKVAIQYEN